jgi:putative GTP pyrophosphokinase
MTDVKTPEEWSAEYAARHHTYVAFAGRLETLVEDLLKAEPIDVIQVESRAKTVASFADKIRRKGHDDSDPFVSVTDLVGIRVITYYLEDVSRVGRILEREFHVDPANSMDKAESLASDQFGYRSAHYVARLTPERANLREWKTYSDIVVEFQVRTSLQHAWAAVSHKIDYKSAKAAPASLQRRLVRLSALFELADEQFEVLRDESEATFTAYSIDVREGRANDVPIDLSSLAAYMQLSKEVANFRVQLKDQGFKTEDEIRFDLKSLARDRSDLVYALQEANFTTLGDLGRYLTSERTKRIVKTIGEYAKETELFSLINGSVDDLLTQVLLVDFDGLDGIAERIYLPENINGLHQVRERIQ